MGTLNVQSGRVNHCRIPRSEGEIHTKTSLELRWRLRIAFKVRDKERRPAPWAPTKVERPCRVSVPLRLICASWLTTVQCLSVARRGPRPTPRAANATFQVRPSWAISGNCRPSRRARGPRAAVAQKAAAHLTKRAGAMPLMRYAFPIIRNFLPRCQAGRGAGYSSRNKIPQTCENLPL